MKVFPLHTSDNNCLSDFSGSSDNIKKVSVNSDTHDYPGRSDDSEIFDNAETSDHFEHTKTFLSKKILNTNNAKNEILQDYKNCTISKEVTEEDYNIFFSVVSTDLTSKQICCITEPTQTFPRQKAVLAVHWHPEFIPIEMIDKRIEQMFPNREKELIIPTQHNEIMSYKGFSGVEVDCWSRGFNQKIQLLLHFKNESTKNAHMLKDMLAHTFKYRSSQLFEFIDTITKPHEERIEAAAKQTGANSDLIRFVQIHVAKIEQLIDQNLSSIPAQSIKNKVLRNFFDFLRPRYGDQLIDRAQTFLTAVKQQVKADFSLEYFFRTSEVIEEARSLNAGIIIPHPEQFWPVLLADYDVDGVEVWNPQSQRYTDFLISVIRDLNKKQHHSDRPLLIFMGDDTHFGEKVIHPDRQNLMKAAREIGIQPPWDDLNIAKALVMSGINREKVIDEYKNRIK
ncbi:conserved hypothetical protein [Desulfamplus magnetovallimortis]|uniref:Uncharacterized protein n=1 Tax=Desulfamplus magnetovallimortis TaxID=1246637 RepID=L0R5K4_9BACT|nr:hypothetical protein [Desulfamplus magnetovallimortis]CCO06802.1 conserved hypothetical protein [Desulfamplus magnetovallimortis BW-1]SLM32853.1 conserved hypothetical protein [Desulfamplus magnetovallimortis]